MKQAERRRFERLVEATERFIKSEQKLLEVLGSRRILKKAECEHFAKDLALSAAKKRSSDVFGQLPSPSTGSHGGLVRRGKAGRQGAHRLRRRTSLRRSRWPSSVRSTCEQAYGRG